VTDVQDFYSAGQAKGSDDPQILIMYSIQAGKIRLPIEGKRYTSSLGGGNLAMIEELLKWWCANRNEWKEMKNRWKHTAMQLLCPHAFIAAGWKVTTAPGTAYFGRLGANKLCCKSTRPLL